MKTLVIHPKDKTTDFLKPIYHGRDWTVITGGTKEEVRKAIDEHDHIIMMGHGTPQGLLSVGQFNKPARKPYSKPTIKPIAKPSAAIRESAGSGPVTNKHITSYYGSPKQEPVVDREPGSDDDLDMNDWFTDRQVGSATTRYVPTIPVGYTTSYVIDDTNAEQLRRKKVTAIWCNADQYMEWNDLSGFYTGMFVSDTSEAMMIGTADTEQWMVDESNFEFARLMRELIVLPNSDTLTELKNRYGRLAQRNAVAKYNCLRLYSRYAQPVNTLSKDDLFKRDAS
jgi:hypothetical protein